MDPERLSPERSDRPLVTRAPEPQRPDPEPQVRRPQAGGSGPTSGEQSSGIGAGGSTPPVSKPGASRGTLLKILAVVFLAAMGWMYFGRSSSNVANAEEASPNYQKNKNANPSVPAVLSAKDLDRARTDAVRAAAIAGNPLPGITNPSPAFVEAAKRGDVTFYAVRVYDSCAEDGDVVTLKLPMGGDIGPIPLTIAGTTVSIPVVTGQPAQISILGVKDGVGGITLGAESSGGTWFSEVLDVGGSETMLLSVQ